MSTLCAQPQPPNTVNTTSFSLSLISSISQLHFRSEAEKSKIYFVDHKSQSRAKRQYLQFRISALDLCIQSCFVLTRNNFCTSHVLSGCFYIARNFLDEVAQTLPRFVRGSCVRIGKSLRKSWENFAKTF